MDSNTLKDLIDNNPDVKKKYEDAKADFAQKTGKDIAKASKLKVEEDPISFVKVEIGYKSGSVVHEVRDEEYSIDALSYTLDKKTQKVKGDEGEFLGFEPTGEYVLTIKVKYTKPQ